MNFSVLLFFLHNVLATLLLGGTFAMRRDSVVKHFGIALLLDSVAFAIWSLAIILRPEALETYVTIGVFFFIASLVMFLRAGTERMNPPARQNLFVLGVVLGVIVFCLRAFVYPSAPSFSVEGLFFFNPHPIAQMLYVFVLALTAFPAIEALAMKFQSGYANLIRYGFIAQVVGGVLLIMSTDGGVAHSLALYITGWIIGLVYLLLWTVFLFSKKAWLGVK